MNDQLDQFLSSEIKRVQSVLDAMKAAQQQYRSLYPVAPTAPQTAQDAPPISTAALGVS